MRKFFLAAMIFFAAFMNLASAAEKISDFETERMRLICALSSLSAYSGDENFAVRRMLNDFGWKVRGIVTQNNRANVKAYLIEKNFDDGRTTKILVIAGTEDIKDVEVDFRLGRVPLHDEDPPPDLTGRKIFVHRGFRDYADAALSGGVKEFLVDELKNNPNETLYITGHSLGGAVALMAAIRLTDSGVDSDRLKVITFGAPAIGNKALAENYADKIDLTRVVVSGDPIKKSLAILGYVQFGKVAEYREVESADHHSHQMAVYLDCAIRNYYNAGGFDKSPEVESGNKIDAPVYVAPIEIVRRSFEPSDEKYILALLNDGLKVQMTNPIFAEPPSVELKKMKHISFDVTKHLASARQNGCKYILVRLIHTKAEKEARQREVRVVFDEILFDSEGMPLAMQTSSETTKNLTIIEATAFAQENLKENIKQVIDSKKSAKEF